MIIHQYGTLTFKADGSISIEGWNVQREPSDPEGPTNEQLLLAFVIDWAKQQFDKAYKSEAMKVLLEWSRLKAAAEAEKNPS